MLSRLKTRLLLEECTGVDIWPVDLCREKGIPESWIEELADCFESGVNSDRETIYYGDRLVGQFHGIHDLQLAFKLGEALGIDPQQASSRSLTREGKVQAIKEAADDG